MASNTTITATPNAPARNIASALITTSEALAKVSRRISFLGEMMGDKEDGLTLSRSAFDALQGYLLETISLANDALQDTSTALDLALEETNATN